MPKWNYMPGNVALEVLFQLLLNLLVLFFFLFDREEHPGFEPYRAWFFLNYALAALVINYLLLPRFYYRKRYIAFLAFLLFVLFVVIVVEEKILEPRFYSGKIPENFPGIWFTLAQVLPVTTILVGFKFGWDAFWKQREVEELRRAIKESQLDYLRSQINPHFLFNHLNNLYAYATENSPKTPEIILELSGVLRYMLYECKDPFVPLTKEVEHLRSFVYLNEMQIEERGEVQFSAEPIYGAYQIAPLILIVFVENAFKHSTSSQSDHIFINIELRLQDEGILEFCSENSYRSASNVENLAKGIGLENARKRLQLLYPGAHQLRVAQTEGRFKVHLTLDLNQSAKA